MVSVCCGHYNIVSHFYLDKSMTCLILISDLIWIHKFSSWCWSGTGQIQMRQSFARMTVSEEWWGWLLIRSSYLRVIIYSGRRYKYRMGRSIQWRPSCSYDSSKLRGCFFLGDVCELTVNQFYTKTVLTLSKLFCHVRMSHRVTETGLRQGFDDAEIFQC